LSTLTFDRVSKRFGTGTLAVDEVSLRVTPGEFVSVVGPSGCGKSTLLSLASGLGGTTGGTVDTGGARIAYVFQEAALLPWRTVLANVELSAELDGVSRAERRAKAREVIGTVGLQGFEDRRPHQLSGGMRMRVSVARALMRDPELFLFDEPFGALDELTRERLGDELQLLFAERRFAGLFITHSIAEAVFLSTRVLVMSPQPGRIIADLPVPFPYPRPPEARFTAEYAEVAAQASAALREGMS
jgi:NitT/TauT family transport system ATP-binding protein